MLDTTTADQIGSSAQDVSLSEAQALLAEMCVRLPERRAPAVAQLEALASGPKSDSVVVHRALGWVYLDKKDFNSSAEELSKGADLSPKDPWLHFYLALLKRRVADSSAAGVQGLPNMIQDLHIMLDWAPDFAEARAMLAMAQLEGGGVNAALDSMRIALQYAPRSQIYLLDMAQIYMAGKYWDAATAMLNRLKNTSDAKVAKSANEQLEGLPTLKKYGIPPQRTPDAGSPAVSPQPPASATARLAASSSSPLPTSSSPGASKSPASPTLADRQTPQPEPRRHEQRYRSTSCPAAARPASHPTRKRKTAFRGLRASASGGDDSVSRREAVEASHRELQSANAGWRG